MKKEKIHDAYVNISYFAGVLAFVSLLLHYGFYLPGWVLKSLTLLEEFIALVFATIIGIRFISSKSKKEYFRESPVLLALSLIIGIAVIYEGIFTISNTEFLFSSKTGPALPKLILIFIQFFILINSFIALSRLREKWLYFHMNTGKILISSFAYIIIIGSFLLMLPKANNGSLKYIDALFTSTSAVCVTGLSSIDVSTVLTFEGQFILMALIQVGGLGIITLTTFVALFLQKGFALRDQIILKEVLDDENFGSVSQIIKNIIYFTFSIEFVGAVSLYIFNGDKGFSEFDRFFFSVFHSVSAYCNAGFSNLKLGLEEPFMHSDAPTLITVMLLIILGGIGFYTKHDILLSVRNKKRKKGLNLQTRIILISTMILIVAGAVLIWIFQWKDWHHLPFNEQLLNSFFSSITSRTAGFANVAIGNLTIPATMIIIVLMYIGAAPNSTAGGIKITTFVTLFLSLWAFIRGKDRVEIGWNTINMIIIRRAFVVFILSIILIFTALFFLTIFESHSYFDLFFETVSAFGTVGLSRGITPILTSYGKIILILVMFFGRIGLFTLATAVGEEKHHLNYKYPEINIMVG